MPTPVPSSPALHATEKLFVEEVSGAAAVAPLGAVESKWRVSKAAVVFPALSERTILSMYLPSAWSAMEMETVSLASSPLLGFGLTKSNPKDSAMTVSTSACRSR